MSSTGFQGSEKSDAELKARKQTSVDDVSIEEKEDTSKSKDAKVSQSPSSQLEAYSMPLVFTGLASFVRMYRIGINGNVVWDEAHFGKFGSYYLRHEFYHDVHPPSGKMLVGLSGYLAGYNGSFDFESGHEYPEYVDFVKMRSFNASFSAMCVPLAYFTAKAIGFSLPAVWLFTCMVLFENSYSTSGRFILSDSMLLFFTVASVFSFVMFHNQRSRPFSRKWWKWLLSTGINLGCTISVKMVGLFVITSVGIYTVIDLLQMLNEKKMSWKSYTGHWSARIVALICVPMAVFMICFKSHFDLLWHSGTGDANMPSSFQAGLVGSDVGGGPRDVAIGSSVSIKNQASSGALSHSHVQTYPEGSNQQQVTAYSYKDANNNWVFHRVREESLWDINETDIEYVVDGAVYRLVHANTQKNLHTHSIAAPVDKKNWEVSGYGNHTIGDAKDYWVSEIVDQKGSENTTQVHPLTTSFRLRNKELDCYLAQTGNHLPEWGFRQHEISCVKDPFRRDKRTWWNVESHENEKLPTPEEFKYPGSGFLKDFIHLNLAMMATNNALVPESDKFDYLASSAWEWPTLHVGLRLCGWGDNNPKYFLLGTPVTTWASSVAVISFMILFVVLLSRWQRQYNDFSNKDDFNLFSMGGFYPILGWGLHFVPFVIMSRVTYVHHYLPALYFALIILTYIIDATTKRWMKSKCGSIMRLVVFAISIASVVGCFWYFSPISFGMTGPAINYHYLKWVKTWHIHD